MEQWWNGEWLGTTEHTCVTSSNTKLTRSLGNSPTYRCEQLAATGRKQRAELLTFKFTCSQTPIQSQPHLQLLKICNPKVPIVLYCTVLHRTVLHRTVLYCTVLYCTVLYCTAPYCTVLYCTVLYCTYCDILQQFAGNCIGV